MHQLPGTLKTQLISVPQVNNFMLHPQLPERSELDGASVLKTTQLRKRRFQPGERAQQP